LSSSDAASIVNAAPGPYTSPLLLLRRTAASGLVLLGKFFLARLTGSGSARAAVLTLRPAGAVRTGSVA